jgi:hypothetical protein
MVGARLTYVSRKAAVDGLMRYFAAIGTVIETGTITETKPNADGTPGEKFAALCRDNGAAQ